MNSQVRAELDCPICLETFKKPIMILPCGHNLCKICLDQLPGGLNKSCPNCRKVFEAEELPRNRILENVIEQLNKPNNSQVNQLTTIMQNLTTPKQRKNSFEIEQLEELGENFMKSKNFSEAKSTFDQILYDVTEVERIKTMFKIAECLYEINKMEETKEMCCEIVAITTSFQPNPDECHVIINNIKNFAKQLTVKKANRAAMTLIRCGVNLCQHFDPNTKVHKLNWVAGAMQEVAESMGESERIEFEQLGIPLLEEIRGKIKTTINADRVKKCVNEAWCLQYIGACCIKIGDYDECVQVYKEAISLMSNELNDDACLYLVFGHCYHNIGVAYKNKKLYNKAENCYLKAIEIYHKATDWPNNDQKNKEIIFSSKSLTEVVKLKQQPEQQQSCIMM